MAVVHALAFVAGALVAVGVLSSAVRTMIVPRSVPSVLARFVFVTLRRLFVLVNRVSPGEERRDVRMAYYAPIALISLPVVWLAIAMAGYTAMYWGLGTRSLRGAFVLSGSSMFTLGLVHPRDLPSLSLVFTEAGVGIGLLALLITYLPTIYATFARRENAVALLEARAGSPPSGPKMIIRYYRIGWPGGFDQVWADWQSWFVDVEESHTSLAALPYFRSPQPDRSWVTAAGAVLDGAALLLSSVDGPPDPEAQLLIRAGYVCLRRIADSLDIPYNPDPRPDNPISVSRDDYDEAVAAMESAGVPLRADQDRAWHDFAGWRVNYDRVLVSLAGFVDAPYAPWSSDRALAWRAPRFFYRGRNPRRAALD